MNFGTVEFQQPLWLLLLALPLLWAGYRSRPGRKSEQLQRFADAHLLPQLIVGQSRQPRDWLFAIAWCCAALAAAGPHLPKRSGETPQRALDVAIVVDISPSMAAPDVAPTRLRHAQWKLRDFIGGAAQHRYSLVVFSANAYVTLPLTVDKQVVRHFVDALDTGLSARHGSSLGLAIERALGTLRNSAADSRAILLVTDGDTDDAISRRAALEAKRQGVPLFILGVGTAQGAPIRDSAGQFIVEDGQIVISRLERDRLQSLASLSGGAYTDATLDDRDIQRLRSAMDELPTRSPFVSVGAEIQPLFPWLLALSALLFVWWGRPTPALALLLSAPLLFHTSPSWANAWDEQQALSALRAGDTNRATALYERIDSFAGMQGRGVLAYRNGDWNSALRAFNAAYQRATRAEDKASARYNAGNSLAQLSRLDEAEQYYREALQWQPNFSRAALNLSLIGEERQRRGAASGTTDTPSDARPGVEQSAQGTTQTPGQSPPRSAIAENLPRPYNAENTTTFLQQRFARQDRRDGIAKRSGRPW